jgi:cytoskeletal protein RodZ
MYQVIVDMLEANVAAEEIAQQLDIPVRQVRAIEEDFYQFV